MGHLLRFRKESLLWSRVNDYDDKRIGMAAWSRYLTADEASVTLQTFANAHYPANTFVEKY